MANPQPARSLPALLLIAFLGSCSVTEFKTDVGYMFMALSGDVGLDASGGGGSANINLGQGLNISNGNSPYAKVEVAASGLRIGLSAFKYGDSGDSVLETTFGDITAGSTVDTDLDLINLKATIAYDVIDLGYLRISPGISIDYFDVDMKMTATSPVLVSEEIEYDLPVPMAYVSATLMYEDWTLDAEASGIYVSLSDAEGLFWDISAKLRYQPLPLVEMFVGYRFLLINASGDISGQDFDTDLHLNGLVFGTSVVF